MHGEMRMQLPCRKSFLSLCCLFTMVLVLAAGAWAQTDSSGSMPQAPSASKGAPSVPPKPFVVGEYAKPRSHFPNPIAPYEEHRVAPPNLTNTPRLDQLMQNGKLLLSMNDAIALALENNLDIAISRYNLSIADTDVLRTKAGANVLGVNTGVGQVTPGGGVGGIGTQVGSGTGGTSLGAGGAGVGVGGIVGSTAGGLFGPLITSFDPILTGSFQSDHFHILPSSTF